ncbi:PucR family transcriptional regulator [Thermobifida halotolerans]|uniref:PucR family transcriptional regulator n=1 Tax=Thermobifida halotolerans TaxID=483545 RepID=A0A399G4W7_9ACTN|nr:PucR family transcriptional regulator [Thermobifida halotolerans]UOE19769.1 PucR family transcriptional regulator [Thermobifida halotolerans]
MPPSLGTVLRTPRLRLRLLNGADRLDTPVRWVAVSELTDPTPYLEGGELLLTTGVRWTHGAEEARGYVRRLLDRGVAGLGFGLGVAHDQVPPTLADAVAEFGLPLVAVPRETPFIAIGKEVSRLLAKAEYEGLSRAFTAQRQLTRAALRGAEAVVDRLGAELAQGWTLLLAPDGSPRHAHPPQAASRVSELTGEVRRLRGLRQPASASLSAGGEHITVQPLGVAGRVRGFLATGGPHPLDSEERTLVNAAASLLSLELERGDPAASDRLRGGLLAALLTGAVTVTGPGAEPLRAALPEEPVVVVVAEGADAAVSWGRGEEGLALVDGGRFRFLGSARSDPGARLAAFTGGPVGVSEPVGHDALPEALAQAERALGAARRDHAELVRHADLPGGFLGLLGTPAGVGTAQRLLAPLRGHRSGAELLASLRAYLAASGRWDAAAESLGVHRHTLRYRIARIRELLPGDLDDPDYRAELWLALRMTERG